MRLLNKEVCKLKYTKAMIEAIELEVEDVVLTSGGTCSAESTCTAESTCPAESEPCANEFYCRTEL